MSDLQLHGKQISGGPAAQRNTYTDAHGSDNSRVFPGLGCFLGVIGGHCWVFSVLAFAIILAILPKESWQH